MMDSWRLLLVAVLATLLHQGRSRPVQDDFNEIEDYLNNNNNKNKREPSLECDNTCVERMLLLNKLKNTLTKRTIEEIMVENNSSMDMFNSIDSNKNDRRSQLECDEQCQELEQLRKKLKNIDG